MAPRRVLIIDDEDELRELIQITFESRGYKVFSAADGAEGLKVAIDSRPDVILLDLKMPKVNGYEFLSLMRKDERIAKTPVIVLTSLTEDSKKTDEEWAESMEVEAFISKPVEPYALVERVDAVIEQI